MPRTQGALAPEAGLAAAAADATSAGPAPAAGDAIPGGTAVFSGNGVPGAFVATEAGGKEGSEAGPAGATALAGMTTAVGGAGSGVCLEQAASASNNRAGQPIRTNLMRSPQRTRR